MPGGIKRKWILTAAAALACFILLITFLSRPSAKLPPPQKLPNGSEVRVVYAGFGKKHFYVEGNALQKLAARILPEKISTKLGLSRRIVVVTNASDTTVIMVRTVVTNPIPPVIRVTTSNVTSFIPWINLNYPTVRLTDDSGSDLSLTPAGSFRPATNTTVQAFRLPVVSPQAKKLALQLLHFDINTTNYPTSRFSLYNPAPHSTPRLKARPLPQTYTMDDLTVVLTGLENRAPGPPIMRSRSLSMSDLPAATVTRAHYDILRNGAPASRMFVVGAEVVDDFGNTNVLKNLYLPRYGSLEFDDAYSPQQAFTFRLEVGAYPPFGTGDTVTLTNVPLPAAPGTSIKLKGLELVIDNLSQSNHFQDLRMQYHITPASYDFRHYVVLKSRDSNGREIVIREINGGTTVGANMGSGRSDSLPVPEGHVDIVFGLVRRRYVEFIASPTSATNSQR